MSLFATKSVEKLIQESSGASDGHAWANPGYSPGRARLLRAGDEVWEDVTPEAMRHRLDETVVATATSAATTATRAPSA